MENNILGNRKWISTYNRNQQGKESNFNRDTQGMLIKAWMSTKKNKKYFKGSQGQNHDNVGLGHAFVMMSCICSLVNIANTIMTEWMFANWLSLTLYWLMLTWGFPQSTTSFIQKQKWLGYHDSGNLFSVPWFGSFQPDFEDVNLN